MADVRSIERSRSPLGDPKSVTGWDAFSLPLIVGGVLVLGLPFASLRSGKARAAAILFVVPWACLYVYWRATSTIDAEWLSWGMLYQGSFFLVDVYLVYHGVDYLWEFRFPPVDRPQDVRASEDVDSTTLVDVLIPTYNESEDVLFKTVVGARRIEHGHLRIWLLDDGKRDWLKQRAAEWGVRYLRRDRNVHAKAGNINAALPYLEAEGAPEFVAIFDADFIPQTQFLKRTLPYMNDDSVAIVQTPQHFYNKDPLQAAFGSIPGWPDSQRFLYDVDLPIREVRGWSTCCGTSFVIRYSDLESMGGFPTDSVSEDTLMSMRLAVNGRRTVYLNEPLSMGLAAEGLAEHMTQQSRWCKGWMEIARSEFGPLHPRKMPLRERLEGLNGFLGWGMNSAIRLVFLLSPIVYWFTGIAPLETTSDEFTFYFVPMWISVTVVTAWITRGLDLPILNDGNTILVAPVVVPRTWAGLWKDAKGGFAVTDKGNRRESFIIHWKILLPFAGLGLLLIAGMIFNEMGGPAAKDGFVGWAYFWTFFNLLCLGVAIVPCVEPPQSRREERFETHEEVLIQLVELQEERRLTNLSVYGAAVVGRIGQPEQRVRVHVSQVGWIEGCVKASGKVSRVQLDPTPLQKEAMVAKLYTFKYVHPESTGKWLQIYGAIGRRLWA